MLATDEMRQLIDSIDTSTLLGLRDRALIALMGYTFACVGAAVGMKIEDYDVQKRRGWVRPTKRARSRNCPAITIADNS
jgi:integrase/recombinase XerD